MRKVYLLGYLVHDLTVVARRWLDTPVLIVLGLINNRVWSILRLKLAVSEDRTLSSI